MNYASLALFGVAAILMFGIAVMPNDDRFPVRMVALFMAAAMVVGAVMFGSGQWA